MATSFGVASTASAASLTENLHKPSANYLPLSQRHSGKVSFRILPRPKFRFSNKGLNSGSKSSAVVRAQVNEVVVDGSSKSATPAKLEVSPAEVKDVSLASEESLSAFITQVTNLVKMVDSKDIVELQLKQLDCELLIRKKEALPQLPSAPITYVQSQPHHAPVHSAPAPAQLPAAAAAPASAPAPVPAKPAPSKSSHPPLKCPMAGTFYRSPGPGEPAFVKVGDKVQKGQVICIIEAMKLMNEIEADQSGTIVEVIAEDAKPVSVDTPLFVIEP